MYIEQNKTRGTIMAPVNKEERICHRCDESHPFGSHTKSRPKSSNQGSNDLSELDEMEQIGNHHPTTGRNHNKINENRDTCGAWGKEGKPGNKRHCFSHCLKFIQANPEERL